MASMVEASLETLYIVVPKSLVNLFHRVSIIQLLEIYVNIVVDSLAFLKRSSSS